MTNVSPITRTGTSRATPTAGAAADISKILTGTGRRAYLQGVAKMHLAHAAAYREAGALEYRAVLASGRLAWSIDVRRAARAVRKAWNYQADLAEAAAAATVANHRVWLEKIGGAAEAKKREQYRPHE